MAVTVRDALDYLRIDEADDLIRANVERAMNSAAARLRGAIGDDVEDYLPDDDRVDQLHLLYTRENYDAENLTEKEIRALKHLRDDLEPQLRRELSRAKLAAAGGDAV
jgi:Asp-tRNA(Asn)/Glu-tRNA(Gln) amidotransferase A subunit family amidase